MSTHDHPAAKLLMKFFAEMHSWEAAAARRENAFDWENSTESDYDELTVQEREEVAHIFERFCEVGRLACRLQEGGMSLSLDEPHYNPEKESIESFEESNDVVVIETKQAHHHRFYYRYELVRVGDEWRIRDNKKYAVTKGSSWTEDIL
ncbi:MAG: NTF2 fold immunity protein [Pirellulales bacterium]